MEDLVAGARAVVAMGGYNTYCEILSFDKPALIVPRVVPREEQLLRARRAAELGLIDMLLPEEAGDPLRMAAALRALAVRKKPSEGPTNLALEGLPNISRIVGDDLRARVARREARPKVRERT
jgi:predicted glycosyltransferase